MSFFREDYLIDSESAERIYREIAHLPIYDYHSHLSPREIYEDESYTDITALWLTADHYKWRLMRMAGVDERYITGDAEPREKFYHFASILPLFIGNPVYDWAHMELKRYFDIDMAITSGSAQYIWNETERIMREGRYSPQSLIDMANVDTIMTTDDPIDDLEYHRLLREGGYPVHIIPTFRADRVIDIARCDYAEYIASLASSTGIGIDSIDSLVDAVALRMDYFRTLGSNIADVSILNIGSIGDRDTAECAMDKVMNGVEPTESECSAYSMYMLTAIARLLSERDMVMQIHIGALRNASSRLYLAKGRDIGADSIADVVDIARLGRWLDVLDVEDMLPRMIVYTHNSSAYYPLSAMLGNFARDRVAKLQMGSAWWMMDHREGITAQLEAVKNTAGLGYINGMLTDSRSFTSFVRHDYFRRVLASFLAGIVDRGGAVLDESIFTLARNISYYNAKRYFEGDEA